MEDLEVVEINIKNKLYGWANKNGKLVDFITVDEQIESGRRLFTIAATVDGAIVAQAKGFNKKDAGYQAAVLAVEKLSL
jgi:ribonuclease-3